MTACGKTHYLLKMLEENFKGHFDYVFFVCPTFLGNKTYQEWKYLKDPDLFAGALRPRPCGDRPGNHRWVREGNKKFNSFGRLRVLPDGKKQNQRVGKTCLPRKAHRTFHDRHHPATHEHCKTLQNERLQGGVFYTARKDDRRDIFENYLCVEREEEKKIMETLKKERYARLEILTVHPTRTG